jgi:hypothetical protein
VVLSLMLVLCGMVCSSGLSHSTLHRRLWCRPMAGLQQQDRLRRLLTWGRHHLSTGALCRPYILRQHCSRGILPHHSRVPM